MALEDFLEEQRNPGRAVGGEASFTLDPLKVRERVATFVEEDSLYPLYRCLQALINFCEGDIFVQRKQKCWQISFQWKDCPPTKAFENLLNLGTTASFDSIGHRACQHLFFGLSAALGVADYHLTWKGSRSHFALDTGVFKTLPEEPSDYTTLSLSVDSSWWQKLTRQKNDKQIFDSLRNRLCYSPTPIHLQHELITPQAPGAPERPWLAKLGENSHLAWRFLRVPDQNFLTIPYPSLDYYKYGNKPDTFHLIREPQDQSLPLSVSIQDPQRRHLMKGQTKNLSLSQVSRAHSALFLSLEGGRQDWLIPVNDGLLTQAVPVDIAGGGIVALTSERSLNYDLSGLKVIENEAFQASLEAFRKESKALKKQLGVSLANMSFRSEHLPKRYEQALSYLVGGPHLGLLGGRLGPKIRRFFGKKED